MNKRTNEKGKEKDGKVCQNIKLAWNKNNFLNSTDTGVIETDPSKITYTNNSQDQWLVHPAFTLDPKNGGGSDNISAIYITNKDQSTTNNATGVYDLSGGAREYVASYIIGNNSSLQTNAGTAEGDLYGATEEEQNTSTAYKTVYAIGNSDERIKNYEANKGVKGDAIYETSKGDVGLISWNVSTSAFPYSPFSLFERGGRYDSGSAAGTFCFSNYLGTSHLYYSFRPVLAFYYFILA